MSKPCHVCIHYNWDCFINLGRILNHLHLLLRDMTLCYYWLCLLPLNIEACILLLVLREARWRSNCWQSLLPRHRLLTGEALESVFPLLLHPIVIVIVLVAIPVEEVLEKQPEIVIVWSLLEFDLADAFHVSNEFNWKFFAELLHWHLGLLLLDHFIFRFFVSHFYALPGQISSEKVYQNEAEALHVVSSRLLQSIVRVQWCIPSSSSQTFVIPERYVLVSAWVLIPLCQPEIDNVDVMLSLSNSN